MGTYQKKCEREQIMGKMLTIKEVAEKLRISTASVLNCIKDRRIHAVRIPGPKKWLIDEESLNKLMS